MSLGSVLRSYFLRSLCHFYSSLKTAFLLSSKEPLFPLSYEPEYGLCVAAECLVCSFSDNFCEHNCLVQFCCKLTHHEMHC